MKEITAQELRNIVEQAISATIDLHRASRASQDKTYQLPMGSPSDEEIDDFLFHDVLIDEETLEQLIDPGLLGFSAKTGQVAEEWLTQFKDNVESWAENNSWLGADESFRQYFYADYPRDTEIWTPQADIAVPSWVENSPTYILLALDLLRQGKLLSELHWRDFEKLIGDLLESEGWLVRVTQATRDGGFDIVSSKTDPTLGEIKAVWQAKKYSLSNKVKLGEVRELSAVRDDQKATKAIIVTTSHLTHDAIEWVKRDVHRLGYKDKEGLESWLQDYVIRLG